MSTPESRFAAQNATTQERLSSHTVGLVKLSDFRKRRAEVLEQQEREAHDAVAAASSSIGPSDRSLPATPVPQSATSGRPSQYIQKRSKVDKKKKINVGGKLSFRDDDEIDDEIDNMTEKKIRNRNRGGGLGDTNGNTGNAGNQDADVGAALSESDSISRNEHSVESKEDLRKSPKAKSKFKGSSSVSVLPKAMTKAALRRDAAERERLRREFMARQEALKATEIAVPFVFYDGTNIPGGVVRVKKGDFVWVFLDKSRKVGAELGVGEKPNSRREWARVGVDDLLMVRGNVIIPHHYEILYFIMNMATGSNNKPLFDYTTDAPTPQNNNTSLELMAEQRLPTAASRAAEVAKLEGASHDPTFTKVVDRRWYERNKHIYPASTWQEFDPEKDYRDTTRRDQGGNTFFYS